MARWKASESALILSYRASFLEVSAIPAPRFYDERFDQFCFLVKGPYFLIRLPLKQG